MPQKLWHWDYFVIREEDIPRAARKDYYGASQVFYNTWCKACLAQKVHELEQQDEEAKRQGRILHIQSQPQLRNDAMDSIDPIPSWREKLEAHIRACRLIDQSAKNRLKVDRASQPLPSIANLALSDSPSSHNWPALGPTGTKMSSEDQQCFESDLCKLWVALGIPWHGINHPQAHIFFHNWRPNAKLPDRHRLSGSILQHEVESAREAMHKEVEGQIAIGMSDGWKNIRHNALLASLMSVNYTVSLSYNHSIIVIIDRAIRLILLMCMIFLRNARLLKTI
ncbi:hypothetical protein RSAG8_05466, partial [Rhizoctonia solani AG-8 WAC10335]